MTSAAIIRPPVYGPNVQRYRTHPPRTFARSDATTIRPFLVFFFFYVHVPGDFTDERAFVRTPFVPRALIVFHSAVIDTYGPTERRIYAIIRDRDGG